MIKIIALILTTFGAIFLQAESPYDSVKTPLPFNDFGWYYAEEPVEKAIRERNIKVIIELGSFMGKSTRHMATLLPRDGVLYAVDHWEGSVEHKTERPAYFPNLPEVLPTLYEQFLSNVIHAKLTHKIVPMRMSTLEACEEFKKRNIAPGLVFVDASHDERSVYEDLQAYYPLIKGRGVFIGDDWEWGEELGFPVQRAVKRFASEHNMTISLFAENWVWQLSEK